MTNPASYDLNDLHSDLTHLSTLIKVITEKALEIPEIGDVTGLLWIARDLAGCGKRIGDTRFESGLCSV
jgi:hypothetical protein